MVDFNVDFKSALKKVDVLNQSRDLQRAKEPSTEWTTGVQVCHLHIGKDKNLIYHLHDFLPLKLLNYKFFNFLFPQIQRILVVVVVDV